MTKIIYFDVQDDEKEFLIKIMKANTTTISQPTH